MCYDYDFKREFVFLIKIVVKDVFELYIQYLKCY